jgi:hypothetical protein
MFDADAMTKLLSRLLQVVLCSTPRPTSDTPWRGSSIRPGLSSWFDSRLAAKGIHLDVLLIDRLAGREVALELKYLTASWQGVARQESFDLLSQGAQDIRAYDCVKDISRVERFVYDRPGADGAVIVVTARLGAAPSDSRRNPGQL